MHLQIAHDVAGVHAPPQKRRYRDLNARILAVIRDYANRNFIGLLTRYFIYDINTGYVDSIFIYLFILCIYFFRLR